MPEPSERRRHRRYDVEDLPGSLFVSSDARVLNMSLTGLAVESSSCLRPGIRYTIEVGTGSSRLRLPASVQWCRLDGTRKLGNGESAPVYLAGLSFREVLGDKAHAVLELLKENVTVELERRLSGRIELSNGNQAQLSESYDLVIKTLSLSGLLALTRVAPPESEIFDLHLPIQDPPLHVSGRVAFARELEEPEGELSSEVGIEFLDLHPTDRKRLESLLVDHIE